MQIKSKSGVGAAGGSRDVAAFDSVLTKGFDVIAKGGTLQSAVGEALGFLTSDPKTRKAVEPYLKKMFGTAEDVLRGSKTGDAGLKALRDSAASTELRSHIGKELQAALGDEVGGKLGGHIGAVLAAFAKSGLAGAITAAFAHTKDVKALIEGAGGTAKVVETVSEKVPVVGLAQSVATHGKTAVNGTSQERWVGFAAIAANVIATVAPSWGATALKAAEALKVRVAKSDKFGAEPPAAPDTTKPAEEAKVPQAADGALFGGADVKMTSEPVAALKSMKMPKGSERVIRDVAKQLRDKAEKAGVTLSQTDAESHAARLVVSGLNAVYGPREVDLSVKEFRETLMPMIQDSMIPDATWAVSDSKFKPLVTAPGALTISQAAITKWYVDQGHGVTEEVMQRTLTRLGLIVAGEVPIVLLNGSEGSLLSSLDSVARGDPLPPAPPPGGTIDGTFDGNPLDAIMRQAAAAEAAQTDQTTPAQTVPAQTTDPIKAEKELKRRRDEKRIAEGQKDSGGDGGDHVGGDKQTQRTVEEQRLYDTQRLLREQELQIERDTQLRAEQERDRNRN